MSPTKLLFISGLILLAPLPQAQTGALFDRVSIAHGGASEYLPFSSLSAFKAAIQLKPDYIETDLQLTKDGVLICFHDVSLERVTNVEVLFPERFVEVDVDGQAVQKWFVADFTLAEIKTLDFGSWFSADYASERIVTFQELIDLSRGKIGLYPETKDPDFYRARGSDIDAELHNLLVRNGLHTAEGQRGTPIVIQSFHDSSLMRLRELNGRGYTLVQLVWEGQEFDYFSAAGLQHVASYADGIAPILRMVLPPNEQRIKAAQDMGLWVHVWHASKGFPAAGYSAKSYMRYLLDDLHINGIMNHVPAQFPARQ